jgi:phosphoglycerate kinase
MPSASKSAPTSIARLGENPLLPSTNLEDPTIEKETIRLFKEKILQSKIIIWNGPLSKTEKPEYAQGTLEIANAIIDSKAFSVVGGGETVEFLRNQGIIDSFSHVSTGGGAMIAYLSGEVLPGIEALKNSKL